MGTSVLKKTHILLLAIFSTLLIGVGFSTQVHAATSLDDRVDMFLRYRAVHDCLGGIDLKSRSTTEIANGDYWDGKWVVGPGAGKPIAAALLTQNADNDKLCKDDDDNFFPDSATAFGFDNAADMYCAIQPIAYRSTEGSGANDYEKCKNGSGNYDASGSESEQASQFLTGLKKYAKNGASVPTDPDGAMSYRIYFRTFETFCDAKRISDYKADRDKVLADSKEYVVVNEVVLAEKNGKNEAKIVPALYKVGATRTFPVRSGDHQDYKVYGVWAYPNGGSYDLTCGQLAAKTWDFDTAYGLYLESHPEEAGGSSAGGVSATEPVCSAGALGWIICPAVNFIGEMTDVVYDMIEKMLYIDPVTVKIGGPLYNTWTRFRDLANILFVAVFLVVIFSQATSVGLSSYGIKRMIPRILAAAVLINISFFIAQIGLDLSNIVGIGLHELVNSMRSGSVVNFNVIDWSSLIAVAIGGAGIYAGIGLVAAAPSVGAALALILPFLVTALFAVVTAIAVLVARQVIIILLVALAPLAFIAMILPNTQKYFQLWQNTFTAMLVMFPLISLLFAGSQLAANIVLTSNTEKDGISFFALIAAVAMMFIPLFGIPYIVKFSGGAIGRVANLVNNPNKGPFDRLRKGAENYRDFKKDQARTQVLSKEGPTRNPFIRRARRTADRAHQYSLAKGIAEETSQEYIANRAIDSTVIGMDENGMPITRGSAYAQRMAGSSNPQHIAAVQASAQATADKLERQSVANREVLMRSKYSAEELIDKAQTEFTAAAMSDDAVGARAAQNILLNAGTPGLKGLAGSIDYIEKSTGFSNKVMEGVKKDLNTAGLKPKDNTLATWAYDPGKIDEIRTRQKTYAGLNDAELVGQIDDNLKYAIGYTGEKDDRGNEIYDFNRAAITTERARDLLANKNLTGLTTSKREILERLANQPPTTGGGTP